MIEIGYTGTRQGMTIEQHAALCKIMLCYHKTAGEFRWHHGLCVGGDKECHRLAKIFDFKVRGHPPNNSKHVAEFTDLDSIAPPKDYLDRNHDIVDETYILIATPKEMQEILRSGTWATMRYAKKQGKKVVRIDPLGNTHNE
jgi:hypothetical protein